MSLVDQATIDRNLAERDAGVKQQMPGVVHAASNNVLMWRLTEHCFERGGKIARAEADETSKVINPDCCGEIVVDEVDHAADLPGSKSATVTGWQGGAKMSEVLRKYVGYDCRN